MRLTWPCRGPLYAPLRLRAKSRVRRILRRSPLASGSFLRKKQVVADPTRGALFAGCRTGLHRAAPSIVDQALPAALPGAVITGRYAQGVPSPLTVTPLQDSRKRQVFVERRPVQTKRRDFDTAHIFLGSRFQPRVALGRKTHLMAAGESDKDHSSLMPCLQGTISQGARPIFV